MTLEFERFRGIFHFPKSPPPHYNQRVTPLRRNFLIALILPLIVVEQAESAFFYRLARSCRVTAQRALLPKKWKAENAERARAFLKLSGSPLTLEDVSSRFTREFNVNEENFLFGSKLERRKEILSVLKQLELKQITHYSSDPSALKESWPQIMQLLRDPKISHEGAHHPQAESVFSEFKTYVERSTVWDRLKFFRPPLTKKLLDVKGALSNRLHVYFTDRNGGEWMLNFNLNTDPRGVKSIISVSVKSISQLRNLEHVPVDRSFKPDGGWLLEQVELGMRALESLETQLPDAILLPFYGELSLEELLRSLFVTHVFPVGIIEPLEYVSADNADFNRVLFFGHDVFHASEVSKVLRELTASQELFLSQKLNQKLDQLNDNPIVKDTFVRVVFQAARELNSAPFGSDFRWSNRWAKRAFRQHPQWKKEIRLRIEERSIEGNFGVFPTLKNLEKNTLEYERANSKIQTAFEEALRQFEAFMLELPF
jgi:hypothetical protein